MSINDVARELVGAAGKRMVSVTYDEGPIVHLCVVYSWWSVILRRHTRAMRRMTQIADRAEANGIYCNVQFFAAWTERQARQVVDGWASELLMAMPPLPGVPQHIIT